MNLTLSEEQEMLRTMSQIKKQLPGSGLNAPEPSTWRRGRLSSSPLANSACY